VLLAARDEGPGPVRPMILGICGPSAAGKTSMALACCDRLAATTTCAYICLDGYHRYDRHERARLGLVPEDVSANDLKAFQRDICQLLRAGQECKVRTWNHVTGRPGPSALIPATDILVIDGLHVGIVAETGTPVDLLVYIDAGEELLWQWRLERDMRQRGYSRAFVLTEHTKRERMSERYVRPQKEIADISIDVGMAGQQRVFRVSVAANDNRAPAARNESSVRSFESLVILICRSVGAYAAQRTGQE
jgi:phosphoribulokinase